MGFGSSDGFTPGRNHVAGNFTVVGNVSASAGFTGDGSNLTNVGGGSITITVGNSIASGTGNRVLYQDSSDELAESANLTFDGTTVTALSVSASNGVSGSVVEGGSLRLAGTNIGASPAELNYVTGVTSAIQTQLDGKSATTGNSSIATVGTITTGVWNGTAIANSNLANSTISGIALGATLGALSKPANSGLALTSYDGSAAVSDLAINFNDLTEAVVNVAADSIMFLDNDGNASRRDSIQDLVTAMAGGGLAATSGQLGVDGVLEDLDTLTPPSSDGEMIVATGAGAFAYESGATLRTSIGLGTTADVTFDSLILGDLTATRLVSSDGSDKLVSTNLNAWVAGTSNQITVTDDTDGTITLSTPQSLDTGAEPTFLTLTGSAGLSGSHVQATRVEIGDTFDVGGNTTLDGTLEVDGNVTLGDTDGNTVTLKGIPSIVGVNNTSPADLYFKADQSGGDENIDNWLMRAADGGSLTLNNMASSGYVSQLSLYPHATQASSLTKVEGQLLATDFFLGQTTPHDASTGTSETLTAAELLTRIVYGTPGGAAAYTLDTAANIVAALGPAIGSSNTTGMAFDVSIINLDGTNEITVGTAAGLTLVGSMAVPPASSALFRFHVTNAGTGTITVYRIS
jgi:hypothetical protein